MGDILNELVFMTLRLLTELKAFVLTLIESLFGKEKALNYQIRQRV
jgi:hypothetical protein